MASAAFGSALLGGGISLLTSVVVLTLTNRLEARRRAREEKRQTAAKAFSGYYKLEHTANVTMALAKHIDTEYAQADLPQDRGVDPAQVVKPLIGSGFPVAQVTPEEMSFLTRSDDPALMAEIWEIQQRAVSNEAVMQQCNQLKAQYMSFLESRVKDGDEMPSESIKTDLSGKDASAAYSRLAQMNSLVIGLIEHLEEDRRKVKSVLERFVAAAVAEFADDFLIMAVHWKGTGRC